MRKLRHRAPKCLAQGRTEARPGLTQGSCLPPKCSHPLLLAAPARSACGFFHPHVDVDFSPAGTCGLRLTLGGRAPSVRGRSNPILLQPLSPGRDLCLIGLLCPAGKRWSAACAYLHPALSRPNLTAEAQTFVSRVLFEGTRAVGVEYIKNGQSHRVSSRQAGAVDTERKESVWVAVGLWYPGPWMKWRSGGGGGGAVRPATCKELTVAWGSFCLPLPLRAVTQFLPYRFRNCNVYSKTLKTISVSVLCISALRCRSAAGQDPPASTWRSGSLLLHLNRLLECLLAWIPCKRGSPVFKTVVARGGHRTSGIARPRCACRGLHRAAR